MLTSARIWSATRSALDPWPINKINSPQELYFSTRNQARFHSFDFVHNRRQLPIGVLFVVRHRDDAQPRSLPEIVVLDLSDGNVEFSDAVFDAPQHHPLFLQRSGARNVKLDGEVADDHCQIGRLRRSSPSLIYQSSNLPICQFLLLM